MIVISPVFQALYLNFVPFWVKILQSLENLKSLLPDTDDSGFIPPGDLRSFRV